MPADAYSGGFFGRDFVKVRFKNIPKVAIGKPSRFDVSAVWEGSNSHFEKFDGRHRKVNIFI